MLLKILAFKQAFWKKERGATAVEYALILVGIFLALVAAYFAFGDELRALFSSSVDQKAGS